MHPLSRFPLLLPALLLSGCAGVISPSVPSNPINPGGGTLSPSSAQMLAALNAVRAQPRLCGSTPYPAAPPLSWNAPLEGSALEHSRDMATRNYFSHTSLDGRSFSARITAAGYVWSLAGENIAAGYGSFQATLEGWIASPTHCQNLMNPSFRDVGIAVYTQAGSAYGDYWTQDFGTPR